MEAPPPTYEESLVPPSIETPTPVEAERSPAPVEAERSPSPAPPPVPPKTPPERAPRGPQPPNDAQHAIAPLKVSQTNHGVTGAYVVEIGDNKTAPDALFKSTNGKLKVQVWLRGSVPRLAEAVLDTTNGSVEAALHRDEGQPIRARLHSTNGKVIASLPADFDGLVALRSTNGKKVLEPAVRCRAIIVPNEDNKDSKTTTYRIAPGPPVSSTTSVLGSSSSSTSPPAPAPAPTGNERNPPVDSKLAEFLGHLGISDRGSASRQPEPERSAPRAAPSASASASASTSATSRPLAGPDRCYVTSTNGSVTIAYVS